MPNLAPVFTAPTYSIRRVSSAVSSSTGLSGYADLARFGSVFSPDGTRMLFTSEANDLVSGDSNGIGDVFLKDLSSGAVTRLSTTAAGGEASGAWGSYDAVFSPDGSKVLFASGATNLVTGDTNATNDLFLKDIASGAVTRIGSGAFQGTFSQDGTRIVFSSPAADLVAGDSNGAADVFVQVLATGAVTRVSVGSNGEQGTAPSAWVEGARDAVFSPDGTKILFRSDLDHQSGGQISGLFLKDLTTQSLTRVSTDSSGATVGGYFDQASFSPDGTKIVFRTTASALVSGDSNQVSDIFVKDLASGAVTRVSLTSDGQQLGADSANPRWSPDGKLIAFDTAWAAVAGDSNGLADVYVKDLASGTLSLASLTGGGLAAGGQYAHFSPDGGSILFRSSSLGDGSHRQVYLSQLGNGPLAYAEGGLPVTLVTLVNVADEGTSFAGGTLGIAVTAGGAPGDRLYIVPSGSSGAGIGFPGNNAISFNGTVVGTLTSANGDLSIALNSAATPAAVQAIVLAARYTSDGTDMVNPTRTVTFTLVDGGGTADGGQDRASFSRIIAVTEVNNRPTGQITSLTIEEDTPYTFKLTDFPYSDPENDALLSVTFFTHLLQAQQGGVFFDADGAGGNPAVRIDGLEVLAADIAAGKLSFVPAADYVGSAQFGFRVRDDGGGLHQGYAEMSASFTIQVAATAGAPTVTVNSGAVNFVEDSNNGSDQVNLAYITLSDRDGTGPIVSAKVQITGGYRPGEDILTVMVPPPYTASFDAATGTLTILGNDSSLTLQSWANLLSTVQYDNLSNAPSTEQRTISFTVFDGSSTSAPATTRVNVTATNDAPSLDLDSTANGSNVFTLYTEREPARLMAPNAVVIDEDSAHFGGGTLRLERFGNSGSATDLLGIRHQGTSEGQIGVSGSTLSYGGTAIGTFSGGGAGTALVVSFNAFATPAAAQAVLRSVTYYNPSSSPPNPGPSYQVTLSDSAGATSAAAFLGVGMILIPDDTVFDLNGAAEGTTIRTDFVKGSAGVLVAPGAVVSDSDTTNFSSFRIEIGLTNAAAADNLSLQLGTGPGSIALDQGGGVAFEGMLVGTISVLSPVGFSILFNQQFVPTAALQAIVRAVGFVNNSEAPATHDRNLAVKLFQPGVQAPVVQNATVAIVAGTPPAAPDAVSVAANGIVLIPAGGADPNAVATIAGTGVAVGGTVTLASGAKVTLNGDGTLGYDPSGALAAGAADSFGYSLNGGSAQTVNVAVFAGGAGGRLLGTAGADIMRGGSGGELFDLSQGGDDNASGGAGNDVFFYGGALSAADVNAGGLGTDTLVLQGNYPALTLGDSSLGGIEGISLQSGSITRWGQSGSNSYDYSLTMADANVPGGLQLRVNAQSLLAGEDFTFDGSAESDGGRFLVYAGFGLDRLTGGAFNDIFFFEAGRFGAGDRIDGGLGNDAVVISGAPAGTSGPVLLDIAAGTLTGIESLSFNGRFASDPDARPSYDVTMQDGNFGDGVTTMIVNASSLGPDQSLFFSGWAVGDGKFRIFGGAGGDWLRGSAGDDVIEGGGLGDLLSGGFGRDVFVYRGLSDSSGDACDLITDFHFGNDRIDLTRIDANILADGNQAFSFIGGSAFSGQAGELRVVYEDRLGAWALQGDVNGDGAVDFQLYVSTGAGAPPVADILL